MSERRAIIESALVVPNGRTVVKVVGDSSESFLGAVVRAHLKQDPALDESQVPRATFYESHFTLDYIRKDDAAWDLPSQIALPDDSTFDLVAQFFGPDLESEPPLLRIDKVGARGGDGFYPAVVTVEVIRAAAEIYGIYVGGRELARFAARLRQKVPFAAVKRWTRTGHSDEELIAWVRGHGSEWLPRSLALLLGVQEDRCISLLEAAGYRPFTSSGDHWFRFGAEEQSEQSET
ncbi:hypothetical protein [Agromyces ramosus]|uniref:Uncharacterized protein n=1 Tax=Agromyces ramosus TaxID=33879 RepID=A0ABU0RCK7_9MICO|nr:hypothetical protein [Agromyces ramosus]MDQ0895791.1 hypothetical protein [Agromyces ramosus]